MTAGTARPHIGTLNEKPLHAALKTWYAERDDRFEVPVDGFVIDLVRGDLLIEIQTGSTSALARKLTALIKYHPVRLVIPIAVRKTITHTEHKTGCSRSRTSPRQGKPVDVFRELVSLRDLLGDSNLCVEAVLIHEEEVRGPRSGARRGKSWTVHERRLVEVFDHVTFHHPADFLAVLPGSLPEPFSTRELAAAIGQPRWMAQKIAYVLREMNVLLPVGKRGNAVLYVRNVGGATESASARRTSPVQLGRSM
jgi:hypothetical protein